VDYTRLVVANIDGEHGSELAFYTSGVGVAQSDDPDSVVAGLTMKMAGGKRWQTMMNRQRTVVDSVG